MSREAVTKYLQRLLSDRAFRDLAVTAPTDSLEGHDFTAEERAMLASTAREWARFVGVAVGDDPVSVMGAHNASRPQGFVATDATASLAEAALSNQPIMIRPITVITQNTAPTFTVNPSPRPSPSPGPGPRRAAGEDFRALFGSASVVIVIPDRQAVDSQAQSSPEPAASFHAELQEARRVAVEEARKAIQQSSGQERLDNLVKLISVLERM